MVRWAIAFAFFAPWRIGHSLIKEKMRKDHIFFGCELSGHYYLGRDLFYEVPFVVLLKICAALQEKRVSLSELVRPLQRYFHSGELNFSVIRSQRVLERLEKKYRHGRISRLDGLRVDFKNWWFLVRSSNTESLLRLVVEAKTRTLLESKKDELRRFLLSSKPYDRK
ncbi:MAG: hypothetical protein HYS52_02010 [Candidatus Wildermuthbacteria bacterium]|nr:hypothetical protein [Candidatus Wildermuthbacteria bacterium]